MIHFIEAHVGEIIAAILLMAIGFVVINTIMTWRFFRRQFRKSIESLSLPALMDEMTTNRKKYQILTSEMVNDLNDRQLSEALYYHLLSETHKRNKPIEEMVLEFTGVKRTASLIVIAQESFRMSGFLLCYRYTPLLASHEVADAYQEIGAKHCARIIRKAAEYADVNQDVSYTIRAQLRSLDEALFWYSRTERVENLIAQYIRDNCDAFLTNVKHN